jgi:hypothetical protein
MQSFLLMGRESLPFQKASARVTSRRELILPFHIAVLQQVANNCLSDYLHAGVKPLKYTYYSYALQVSVWLNINTKT